MDVQNAYDRRATLTDDELERLLAALLDDLERYRHGIRNYPPKRLERYGTPFLAKLQGRVHEVERLVDERTQRLT
jgi:hypothetical protein